MIVKILTVLLVACKQYTKQLIYQWQTRNFNCFSVLLNVLFYEQFFDLNCFADIGSKGKIWKSVQNSLFHWKNEDKSFGYVKDLYPFSGKNWAFSYLFQSHREMLWLRTWCICVFRENHKNLCFREKCRMQEVW